MADKPAKKEDKKKKPSSFIKALLWLFVAPMFGLAVLSQAQKLNLGHVLPDNTRVPADAIIERDQEGVNVWVVKEFITIEIGRTYDPGKEVLLVPKNAYVKKVNIREVNTFYHLSLDGNSWGMEMLPCNGVNGITNAVFRIPEYVKSINGYLIEPLAPGRTNAHLDIELGIVLGPVQYR
jgi:hypothetical protein